MVRDDVLPDQPIFRGNARDWHARILAYGLPPLPEVSLRARAIAIAVFRAASVWHQMFWSPLDFQIASWAQMFDGDEMSWLTVNLAEHAVNDHFRQSITGQMLPAHVTHGAAVLLLEQEAQHGP